MSKEEECAKNLSESLLDIRDASTQDTEANSIVTSQQQLPDTPLNRPIDIILNQRYMDGNYLNPKNALDVYDGHIKCEEDEKNFQDLYNKIENQDEQYLQQRVLQPQDGMIHYYGSDEGKIWIDKEKNIYEHKIQMMISVTMYNEDYNLLALTLGSIQKNMTAFQKLGVRPDQVVVVVLQDGIEKVNEGVLENVFDEMDKEYKQDEEMNKINKQYRQRLEEIKNARKYINQIGKKQEYIDKNNNFPANIPKHIALVYQSNKFDILKDQKYPIPLNIFFCNKHLNGKKLSSHCWVFQGFCRQFQPKYITLMDCGTQSDEIGVSEFYKALENSKNIGGVAGHLSVYYDRIEEIKTQKLKYNLVCKEIENEKRKTINKKEKNVDKLKQKIINREKNQEGWNNSSWSNRYNSGSFFNDYIVSTFRGVSATDHYHRKDYLLPEKEKELEEIRKHGYTKPKNTSCFLTRFFKWILSGFYHMVVQIHYFFDVRKAQEYEYLFCQIVDRRYESFFNFSMILPGAWSAFRLEALFQEETPGEQNTVEKWYLKSIIDKKQLTGSIEEQNILLGEDRILTMAAFFQKNCKYTLNNVPSARAKADAIDNFTELVSQRRRWCNAQWFYMTYIVRNYCYYMKNSKHPIHRKYCTVPIMIFIACLFQAATYTTVAMNFFLMYNVLQLYEPFEKQLGIDTYLHLMPGVILTLYIIVVLLLIMISLNYKANKNNSKYKIFAFLSALLALYDITFYVLAIYGLVMKFIYDDEAFSAVFRTKDEDSGEADVIYIIAIVSILINLGSFAFVILCSLLEFSVSSFKDAMRLILSFSSYLYYKSAMQYTFITYGFCNIDDFSWGTKGSNDTSSSEKNKDAKNKFVLIWVVINILLVMFLVFLDDLVGPGKGYVLILYSCLGITMIGIKCFVASSSMMIDFLIKRPFYFIRNKTQKKMQKIKE